MPARSVIPARSYKLTTFSGATVFPCPLFLEIKEVEVVDSPNFIVHPSW